MTKRRSLRGPCPSSEIRRSDGERVTGALLGKRHTKSLVRSSLPAPGRHRAVKLTPRYQQQVKQGTSHFSVLPMIVLIHDPDRRNSDVTVMRARASLFYVYSRSSIATTAPPFPLRFPIKTYPSVRPRDNMGKPRERSANPRDAPSRTLHAHVFTPRYFFASGSARPGRSAVDRRRARDRQDW